MPYVQVKDLDMFYEKMGYGDPVIFLHSGYSRGILAFASQLLDFQKAPYTCYYPDFRGHGRTRCESLVWSSPQLADDMLEFMNRLNLKRAHLIGYSLGASVGQYMAIRCPERVATLTTIGSCGFADPTGVEEFEPEWLIEHGKTETIRHNQERHEEAHRGDWQQFMRQSAIDWRLYPDHTEDELRSIRCPSLFIAGEHDPFADEPRMRRLGDLVEGSQVWIVPGGSHRPHMLRESPVLVNDTILEFLRRHPLSADVETP
ncbi:alpha/beta fold hydrolase [Paenibacillus sp. HJGM_3]|uniref:alpha/beta fold hydrolase n=1 Tax=Paenibacillus sp. HJGM_3 TaxID=3379816 RepID=UPI003858818B